MMVDTLIFRILVRITCCAQKDAKDNTTDIKVGEQQRDVSDRTEETVYKNIVIPH